MKSVNRWKSFDFGPKAILDENIPHKKLKTNRKSLVNFRKNNHQTISNNITEINFLNDIIPQTVGDLCVHPKKIKEIEEWLKFALHLTNHKKNTQFLLLTGPTGCGKTATTLTVCKSMNVKVVEWINPVDIDFEFVHGSTQTSRFLDFFSQSKYSSLFDSSDSKKILLVKEFPNIFLKRIGEFFDILEECYYKATYPVIFICSDTSSKDLNFQRILFPEEVQMKYSIANINFNACAPTLLKKAIERAQDVLKRDPNTFKVPSPAIREAVITSSGGDIRLAIHQFYMASLRESADLHIITDNKKSHKKCLGNKFTIKNMGKDEKLGLFHGLGRVLNPKRQVDGSSWRINCDIEKLIDEFNAQPNNFSSFLFENYLKYFGNLLDAGHAADVLSFTSLLLGNWENSDCMKIGLWIEVLGLMIFNQHRESRWTQISAPKKIEKKW